MAAGKQQLGGSLPCHTVHPVSSDRDLLKLDSVGFTVTTEVAEKLSALLKSLADQCEQDCLIDVIAFRRGSRKGRVSAKIRV
jgi:hypothetical protein